MLSKALLSPQVKAGRYWREDIDKRMKELKKTFQTVNTASNGMVVASKSIELPYTDRHFEAFEHKTFVVQLSSCTTTVVAGTKTTSTMVTVKPSSSATYVMFKARELQVKLKSFAAFFQISINISCKA